MDSALPKSHKKRKASWIRKFIWATAIGFTLWAGLWVLAKHMVSTHIKTVMIDATQFEDSVTITGFPFAFKVDVQDYHFNIAPYLIKGNKAQISWHILRPLSLRGHLKGAFSYAQDAHKQHAPLYQVTNGGLGSTANIGFGFSGVKTFDIYIDNADFSANMIQQTPSFPERIEKASFRFKRQGKKRGDARFSLNWKTIGTTPPMETFAFLGKTLADGYIEGHITHLFPALAQATRTTEHIACALNDVGGGVEITHFAFDFGSVKPRFTANLDPHPDGLRGVIRVLFQDTARLFDSIFHLFAPSKGDSELGLDTVRLALEAAEANAVPVPLQIQKGEIQVLSQPVARLYDCDQT